ncbi:hypothetical protein F949_02788 [Acinetobacter junii NIPH 182]|nr:hypothetical protein F949_02788 [Acinetobacter junii NIPH 182]
MEQIEQRSIQAQDYLTLGRIFGLPC